MKTVLVLIAPGYEEIETITVVDILRRAGARVTLAGTEEGPLEGSRGIQVLPDSLIKNILETEFDLVVLPGGQPGTDNLKKDARVLQLLNKMNDLGRNIAAICAAPLVFKTCRYFEKSLCNQPSICSKCYGGYCIPR